jgi:Xaa-Pro aminopeptidase
VKKTTPEVIKDAFSAKLTQAVPLLQSPLMLLRIKWDSPNLRMFLLDTEFTRPTALILLPTGKAVIVCHAMEAAPLEPLKDVLEVIAYQKADGFMAGMQDILRKGSSVAIEHSESIPGLDLISHTMYKQLKKLYNLQSAESVLLDLRAYKNDTELSFIREAVDESYMIMERVGQAAKPGVTEAELNRLIHHMAVDFDKLLSFSPIVAAGPRATDPHPVRYTQRKLEHNDRLIVDLGLWCHGYASDITRTFHIGGEVSDLPWYQVDRQIIARMQELDLTEHTPLSLGKELQNVVKDAGMLGMEKHSYGHGLGVEVHDIHPLIAAVDHPLAGLKLQDGCVFTMEPGFYDESGGFRIEDDYVIKDGHAVLIK